MNKNSALRRIGVLRNNSKLRKSRAGAETTVVSSRIKVKNVRPLANF